MPMSLAARVRTEVAEWEEPRHSGPVDFGHRTPLSPTYQHDFPLSVRRRLAATARRSVFPAIGRKSERLKRWEARRPQRPEMQDPLRSARDHGPAIAEQSRHERSGHEQQDGRD